MWILAFGACVIVDAIIATVTVLWGVLDSIPSWLEILLVAASLSLGRHLAAALLMVHLCCRDE
jgi:hypothetical protein